MLQKTIFPLLISLFLILAACSKKISKNAIIDFNSNIEYKFKYFANGHLGNGKYPFRTVEKERRSAGEIVRASDASTWSGMYAYLPQPIYSSDGKRFTMDVWMDHYGSVTLKLEESVDGGPTTSKSVKNTKLGEWETIIFNFEDDIFGGPSYPKITIFSDIHTPATGKDVYSYFANLQQIPTDGKGIVHGDKKEAIKIVVLGSSTASGTGPTDSRNAWVNRYRRRLQALNGHHQVINLAVGGYTTYQLLPNGTPVVDGKPAVDPKHNVTKALSFEPDAIVINLPSNDAHKGHSLKEQLENYKLLCQPFYNHRIPVWISTPQGRNMEKEKRAVQRLLRDSTYIRFGRRTLDFWSELTDWSGKITSKYDSGDGIHLNDEGHRLLFEEVWSKDILGLVMDQRRGIVRSDTAFSSPDYYEGYVLEWQDEFDGTELNTKYWTHELGDGCPELCGWGNREKVWYRPENCTVKNGKLIITAKQDKEKEGFWSASRIITNQKVDFRFGRIDIRAKLPKTRGLWPALWLLGNNITKEGWPYCGEIDIMEEVGHIPYRIRGTLHFKNKNGDYNHKGDKYELKNGNFSDDFHVYSIDWDQHGIKFLVDNQIYSEQKYSDQNIDPNDNPFLKPFYMIINCAVGGNLPGGPDHTSIFPQTFEVDYVRYFKSNKRYYLPKVEEYPQQMPKKENLWIYLMAGQSNMVGAGIVGPQDTVTNERLLTMNRKGDWILAKEPIHFHTNSNTGLDCGHSFGNNLLECLPDSISIAVIPTAMGGSSIDHWLTDSLYRGMRLWSNMKSKIRATEKGGTFKGMIWHQGETDAKADRLPYYKEKLKEFFSRVRIETNYPNMPIVTGELGKFDSNRPQWIALNEILKEMSEESDIISYIQTSDLDDKGDEVHFNAEAQRMIGRRYALEMAEMHGYAESGAFKKLERETAIENDK